MPNEVFISYSRRDLDFVSQLHQYLTGKGISAWFDQESIELGDQWRESIVNGIMDCKIFVLVLSPDSTASANVRKEIDLAERHKKQIVPIMWRHTDFPTAIQYQLVGIQYLDFKETATEANLDKVTGVLTKLLGGVTISEAAPGEPVVESKAVPVEPAAPPQPSARRPSRLGRGSRLKKKPQASAAIVGGTVMARVVTPLALDVEAQDTVNNELQWLFTAADHFLKIRQGETTRETPVRVDIPPDAETGNEAHNTVLVGIDDFSLQMIESQIESIIKQINIYLRNLTFELDKQALLGGAAASNIALMNSIKAQQTSIVERTQELARLMQQVYGVMVYSPDDLADFLS